MIKIERGTPRAVVPRDGRRARQWVALSSADFAVPTMNSELLLAYEVGLPTSVLEEGLQKALSDYPEFAGRIVLAHPEAGRPAIVLNDAGAALIEAEAQGPLPKTPYPNTLPFHPSLPVRDLIPPHFGAPQLLLVQVTRFTCGGMTVGLAFNHHVADGEALFDFFKAWTLRAQGLPVLICSTQDRSFLMGRNPPNPTFDHIEFKMLLQSKKNAPLKGKIEEQEVVLRKLHFSAKILKQIKEEAMKEGEEFTRFESLMGHLWRCITRARGLHREDTELDKNKTMMSLAVNARKRMEPKIGEGYFGNVLCAPCASANPKQLIREPLSYASLLIKEAIKKVDEVYVRSMLDYVELKERFPFEFGSRDEIVLSKNLAVSSWVTFPLYDLDFGLGLPLFAGNTFVPYEGTIYVLPSPIFDGSLQVVLGLSACTMDNLLSTYQLII